MSDEDSRGSLKIETEGFIESKKKLITGLYIVCFGIVCQLLSFAYTYNTLNQSIDQIITDLDNGAHKIIAGIWIGGMIIQVMGFLGMIKGLNQLYNYLRIDISNQDHNLDLILNAVNKLYSKIESTDVVQSNEIGVVIVNEENVVNKTPHKSMKHDSIDSSGYEWLIFDNSNWYRNVGSEDEWSRFDE